MPLVAAWLTESDFDELLFLGGRSAARGPAAGEPTRCLLFPNPLSIQQMGPFAFRKKQRLMRSLWQPQLTIGCQESSRAVGLLPRFSWRGNVPSRVNAPADYSVSSGDWLMLVEEFGLAPYLKDGTHWARG